MSLLDSLLSLFFKKKVGLALSGGAARGLAHIGVLKALKKNKIPIDFIAGTSSGAIVGAIYAAGMDPDIMEINAKKLGWFRFMKFPVHWSGILSTHEIEKFLIQNIGSKEIPDINIPFAAVATDLKSGKEVIITEGSAARAAATSSAFPGIFSAVLSDKSMLVDGGLINNLPVSVVKKMGADFVIAVDCSPAHPMKKLPVNQFQVMGRAYDIIIRKCSMESRDLADILIEPEIPEDIWHFDIDEQARLIKAGEEAAKKMIPAIKAKLLIK